MISYKVIKLKAVLKGFSDEVALATLLFFIGYTYYTVIHFDLRIIYLRKVAAFAVHNKVPKLEV